MENTTLQDLSLRYNKINDINSKYIADILCHNNTIKILHLSILFISHVLLPLI